MVSTSGNSGTALSQHVKRGFLSSGGIEDLQQDLGAEDSGASLYARSQQGWSSTIAKGRPMSSYFVYTNPVEGREDEYNDWYDQIHIPEILAMFSNITAAKRYHAVDTQNAPQAYLAIYDIEGDASSTIQAIGKAMASGELTVSDSVDGATAARMVWVKR